MATSPTDLKTAFDILHFDAGNVPVEYRTKMQDFFFHSYYHLNQRSFFLAVKNDTILGMLKYVEQSGYVANAVGLATIETRENFRKMGIASALAGALMEHTRMQGKRLRVTAPEPNEAAQHFQTTLDRLAQEHNIELIRGYE